MKEIKEIIDMGRRLDELAFETYGLFAKREDFDPALVVFWSEMAEWKKTHTILNEFCLVTDIYLEIFYSYDESAKDVSTSCVEECESNLVKMANTLKPYLRLNPLYAVLLRSIVDLKHKYDFLLSRHGRIKKQAV